MVTKSDLKILLRSGSYKFMRDLHAEESEEVFQYKGRPVYYRAGSSDMYLIYMILIKEGAKAEYWLPEEFKPKVILDIGANIGVTSIYYANRYPDARIYAFEPVPANYALLEKNLKEYKNAKAYNMALGAEDGELDIYASESKDNYGGASFKELGVEKASKIKVKRANAAKLLKEIAPGDIDLIKIDTEGSEFDILTSIDRKMLSKVKWIVGELHGVDDYKLLDYLSEFFDIQMKKTLKNRLFIFNACNKNFIDKISKKNLGNLF